MNENTELLVTDKGSIILPSGNLAVPGNRISASEFRRHQEQLKILLAGGNLSERLDQPVSAIDVNRVPSPGLPIAGADEEGLDEKKAARMVSGSNDAATIARLAEIKAAQEAAKKAEAERQQIMAEVENQPMTPEEAQALGLISQPKA